MVCELFAMMAGNGGKVSGVTPRSGDGWDVSRSTEGLELILPLVYPHVKGRDPIIETIICCRHGSLQLLIPLLGGLNVIDQTVPDVVQHQNGTVDTSRKAIELSKFQQRLPHSITTSLMLARLVLAIQMI